MLEKGNCSIVDVGIPGIVLLEAETAGTDTGLVDFPVPFASKQPLIFNPVYCFDKMLVIAGGSGVTKPDGHEYCIPYWRYASLETFSTFLVLPCETFHGFQTANNAAICHTEAFQSQREKSDMHRRKDSSPVSGRFLVV